MKRQIITALTIVMGASVMSSAVAQQRSSLPLQLGVYVQVKMPCDKAAHPAVMEVAQNGMAEHHNYSIFKRIAQVGATTYKVTEEVVIPLRDQRSTREVIYDIPNGSSFTLTVPDVNLTLQYRLCPKSSLPDPWRRTPVRQRIE